jgi:small multidrug resistance pump
MIARMGDALGSQGVLAVLILGSAFFYTASMVAMKLLSSSPASMLIPVIAGMLVLALVLATGLEVLALRTERLGMVYVAILGAEVVMIALVTTLGFGEAFSQRELAGCALVIAGTALAWS